MWFDDEELTGRRLPKKTGRTRKKGSTKKTNNVRLGASKKFRPNELATVSVVAIGLLFGVFAVFQACRTLKESLLSDNDRYMIRHLDIHGGMVMTQGKIREFTGVEEGMNLFEVDITGIRREFLKAAPNVHDMEITRILPDRLRIHVRERIPLARIGSRGLVADREGCVFSLPDRRGSLPAILGYEGASHLQPGMRLQGLAQAGLELLDVCENPEIGLTVSSVEVNKGGVVEFVGSVERQTKTVRLCWGGMGERTRSSRERLLQELCRVIPVLRSRAAARHRFLDATILPSGRRRIADVVGQG